MEYDIEILKDVNMISAIEDEWLLLLDKQCYPSYLQDPRRLYLELGSGYKEYKLKIIILRENGSIVSIAPFEERFMHYPIRFGLFTLLRLKSKRVRLIGHDIICDPDVDKQDCVKKILSLLEPDKSIFTTLAFEEIQESSELWGVVNGLDSYKMICSKENNVIYSLNMSEDHLAYLASMRKKTRYNLKRNVKRFYESCLENVELFICDHEDKVEKYLLLLDKVFFKSWQGNVLGHEKRSTDEAREYYRGLANLGWLRSYVLHCNNKPIAFVFGIQYKNIYYYEETGYDAEYSSIGPGNVLTYMLIEDLYRDRKPEIVDFGHGENKYKRIFGNNSISAFSIVLIHKNQKYRFIAPVQLFLDWSYWSLRKLLIRLRIDSIIRSLIKTRRT